MDLYFTSKNDGPSWNSSGSMLVYVGQSLPAAIKAVGDFVRYEQVDFSLEYPATYTALPNNGDWKIIKFYAADGWWYSIVKATFSEETQKMHMIEVSDILVVCSCGFRKVTSVGTHALRLAYGHAHENAPACVTDRRLCSNECRNGVDKPVDATQNWHHWDCFNYKRKEKVNG